MRVNESDLITLIYDINIERSVFLNISEQKTFILKIQEPKENMGIIFLWKGRHELHKILSMCMNQWFNIFSMNYFFDPKLLLHRKIEKY